MRRRIPLYGNLSAAAVFQGILFLEQAVTGSFRSKILAAISQDSNDLMRRGVSKFAAVQHFQHVVPFVSIQLVCWRGMYCSEAQVLE